MRVFWGLVLLFIGCNPSHISVATPPQSTLDNTKQPQSSPQSSLQSTPQPTPQSHMPLVITLSFVGDCVLGDYKGASGATFNAKFEEVGGDYSYFSKGVLEVLGSDDLSVANLEGVLSDRDLENMFQKQFSFKGASEYANILRAASIESVNLANNHTRDYGTEGFQDTKESLKHAEIMYFGEGILRIAEIKGKKFGFSGHRGWSKHIKQSIKKDIARLKEMGAEVVIFSFHWGNEREHIPNELQSEIAYFSIDNGADLIIGHHPHVLQGIQEYKGKKIVYSLGNFIYGGAKNPQDKDSMIYQVDFTFYEDMQDLQRDLALQDKDSQTQYLKSLSATDFNTERKLKLTHRIIPVSISGSVKFNDYSPIVFAYPSQEYQRIMERLEEYSLALPSKLSD